MSDAGISQFDWRLVDQQRQINDCVFRLFDSFKYLTTLRSNISPCQTTLLILISLYDPSFHLWEPSEKCLGTTVFLSWMPFKICDCRLSVRLHLSRNSGSRRSLDRINLHFLALYTRLLIKEAKKMWKTFEIFCRNGKLYVERDACRRKINGKIVAFLSSVVYYFEDLLKSGNRALLQNKYLLVYNLIVCWNYRIVHNKYMLFIRREVRIGKNCARDRGQSSQYGPTLAGE